MNAEAIFATVIVVIAIILLVDLLRSMYRYRKRKLLKPDKWSPDVIQRIQRNLELDEREIRDRLAGPKNHDPKETT